MSELKTGKYQSYPEYKDSGVECLGKVPEHWEVKKIKHFGRVIGGFAFKSGDFVKQGYPVIKITNVSHLKISYDDKSYLPENFAHDNAEYIAPLNSLVFAMTRPIISGGIKVAKMPRLEVMPLVNQRVGFIKIESEDLADYILFSSLSNSFITQFKNNMTITNQPNISGEGIESVLFPFPPEKELKKIVSFLDHETAKIDTLIEKQQQLIKLLKEKRQAVISHTVTKGLNPQAPMKGSGVDWLGKVPEHWIVCRLKNALTIRNGRDYKQVEVESGGYPVYGSGGVFKRSSKYLFDGSSVLFGRKGTIDKPLVVSGKFWTVDTMFYSEINTFHEAKYIYYQASMFPFSLLSTSTALPSMTQEDLLNLGFVSPPLTEQQEIVEYLKIKLDRFEVLISKVEQSIILSKERRIALISAAVTGKIDVRNWEQPND